MALIRSLREQIPRILRQVTFVRRDKHRKIGGMAMINFHKPLPGWLLNYFRVANSLHLADLRLITFHEIIDRARHWLLEDLRDSACGRH